MLYSYAHYLWFQYLLQFYLFYFYFVTTATITAGYKSDAKKSVELQVFYHASDIFFVIENQVKNPSYFYFGQKP